MYFWGIHTKGWRDLVFLSQRTYNELGGVLYDEESSGTHTDELDKSIAVSRLSKGFSLL